MLGKLPEDHELEFDVTGCFTDDVPSDEESEPVYRPTFEKVNPLRTPSYRLERANDLAKAGQEFSTATDDAETGVALQYVQALNGCRSESDRQKLAIKMPAINKAHEIHQKGGRLRWVLEAYLLTGQASEEIGPTLGLPAAVVDWYERIFFSVRDRLSASDWVMMQVVGRKFVRGEVTTGDIDVILKWLAYSGGAVILQMCLPYLLPDQVGVLCGPEQVTPELAQRIRRLVEALCNPEARQIPPELQNIINEASEQKDTNPNIKLLAEELVHVFEKLEEEQVFEEQEEDLQQSEPDQPHPDWPLESDERENA